jgi:hypothetical protein
MHGTDDEVTFQSIDGNAGPFILNYACYVSTHDWERADDRKLAKFAAHIGYDAKQIFS